MLGEAFEPRTGDRRSRQWRKVPPSPPFCPPQPGPTDHGHRAGRPPVPRSRPSGQPASNLPPIQIHIIIITKLVLAPKSGKAIMLQYIPHLVVFWHWSQDGALSPTLGGLKAGSPTILPLHQSLQLLHPLAQAFYLGFHRK